MKMTYRLNSNPVTITGIIIIISSIAFQAQRDSKARIVKIHGNEVVVCPVNEITDTINIPLSTLIESLEIIKLETTEKALVENAWFTDISDKYVCLKTTGGF